MKSLIFDAIERSRQMAFSKLQDIAAENHNKQTPKEVYASEYLKHAGNTSGFKQLLVSKPGLP